MDWLHIIPWAAVVAIAVQAVTFIIWLVRLDGWSSRTAEDFKSYKEAQEKAADRSEKDVDERFGAVNLRFGLVEGDVRELQITVITKEDLREMKTDLTKSIEDVANRMSREIDKLDRRPLITDAKVTS